MAVGRQQVEPTVQVVVEEENAEGERLAAGRADTLPDGLIGEGQRVALRNVKGGHLVGEVADGDAEGVVFLKPARVNAHRPARAAVVVESNTGDRADFLEGAVMLVVQE